MLGVDRSNLVSYGAVSQEVVEQMALGTLKLMQADFAIATSGIAGPDGGTPDKPVGTVWIALGTREKIVSKSFQFKLNREQNIERTTQTALLMLLDAIRIL